MSRMLALVMFVMVCRGVVAVQAADEVAGPTAAELVRAVFESEQWIHEVDSLQMRLDSRWNKSQESGDHKLARWNHDHPRTKPNLNGPQFQREFRDTVDVGFDQKRYYYRYDKPSMFQHWVWNGEFGAYRHIDQYHQHETFGFISDVTRGSTGLLLHAQWPRSGPHMFWFTPKTAQLSPDPADLVDMAEHITERAGNPEKDFSLLGRQEYRGVDCWVVQSHSERTGFRRLFIGVKDRLLYGQMHGMSIPPSRKAAVEAIGPAVANEAGLEWPADEPFLVWIKTLPQEQQEKLKRAYFTRFYNTIHPLSESWCAEYREVSPGRWFPMVQGYRSYQYLTPDWKEQIEPFVEFERLMTVTHIAINEPLSEELMRLKPAEGVRVVDERHEPALVYVHRDNMTPQERDAIVAEAKQRGAAAADRNAAQQALIGKPAPAFAAGGRWLHSEPLAWQELKGKVVLVEFFAEWCAPCRNHLPGLVGIHDNSSNAGVVVIGVHTSGSDRAKVDKFVEEFGLKFPIFIDAPPPAAVESWGAMYGEFGVKAIPHTVVIDRDGKIAAQGGFNEMAFKAVMLSKRAEN